MSLYSKIESIEKMTSVFHNRFQRSLHFLHLSGDDSCRPVTSPAHRALSCSPALRWRLYGKDVPTVQRSCLGLGILTENNHRKYTNAWKNAKKWQEALSKEIFGLMGKLIGYGEKTPLNHARHHCPYFNFILEP